MHKKFITEPPVNDPFRKYEVIIPLGIFATGLIVISFMYMTDVYRTVNDDAVHLGGSGQHEVQLPTTGAYKVLYEEGRHDGWGLFSVPDAETTATVQLALTAVDFDEVVPVAVEQKNYRTGPYNGIPLYTFYTEREGNFRVELDVATDASGSVWLVPDVDRNMRLLITLLAVTLVVSATAFVWLVRRKRREDKEELNRIGRLHILQNR